MVNGTAGQAEVVVTSHVEVDNRHVVGHVQRFPVVILIVLERNSNNKYAQTGCVLVGQTFSSI